MASFVNTIESQGEELFLSKYLQGNHASLTLQDDTLTKIGPYAFYRKYVANNPDTGRTVTSINLPKVKEIGHYAFHFAGVSSINLPEVEKIHAYAFSRCSITSLNLPKVTELYSYSFSNCTSLREVKLPKLIGTYEETITSSSGQNTFTGGAFSGCKNLTSVSAPLLRDVCSSTFSGCTALSSINLPSAVTLGNYVFNSCSKLTTVTLPLVESIGTYCFALCSILATLDLPKLKFIGSKAFNNSPKFKTLILRNNSRVCVLENVDAFTGTLIESGTGYIYVPSALKSMYESAENWSTYASQIRAIEDYPDVCEVQST